jgi:hypothetical protein
MRRVIGSIVGLLAGMTLCVATTNASVSAPSVGLTLQTLAQPTAFSAEHNGACLTAGGEKLCDRYTVLVTNTGTRPTNGQVTVIEHLPPGVVTYQTPHRAGEEPVVTEWACSPEGSGQTEVTCTTTDTIPPLASANPIWIPVTVEPGAASHVVNEVTVSGGVNGCGEGGEPTCPSATTITTTEIGGAATPFAPLDFTASALDAAGGTDTQAADRLGGLFAGFAFPTDVEGRQTPEGVQPFPVEDPKQIIVDTPPGLVGNPQAAATCPLSNLENTEGASIPACSPASRVGTITVLEPHGVQTPLPLFNIVPENGYAAEFGAYDPVLERAAVLYASVTPYPEYAVRVISAPQDRFIRITGLATTFFGNPAAIDATGLSQAPFLANPSDCRASGFTTTIHVDSWQHPGTFLADGQPNLSDPNWKSAAYRSPAVQGCGTLQFHPAITIRPEAGQNTADQPAGYQAALEVPQNEDPNGLATPPVKKVAVTLPSGVAISPSAANGLVGCEEAGEQGIELESASEGRCPAASKVGTVELETPLLKEALTGSVYVAQPNCGGLAQPECTEAGAEEGDVFALYLEVGSEQRGIHLKLRGVVEVGGNGHNNNLALGQVRTTFSEAPQQPFSALRLSFRGGPTAPLANPQSCGTFISEAELEPWSHQPSPGEALGTPNTVARPGFVVGGCEGGFTPSFVAGSTNPQAGAFSPFTVMVARKDREQNISIVSVALPPGVEGVIAGIPRCPETDAQAGVCPPGSRIGSVTASAGSGERPLWQSGSVYLTDAYRGAPFGLAIVVPAKAGPYNLGHIVVRAAITVNPQTAAISVTSDPIPQSIDGVPLRIKTIDVSVDRARFTSNPTNCNPTAVLGMVTSTLGTQASQSARFQVGNCSALPFTPTVSASTQAKTSKANGAALTVRIGQAASEANIGKVDVQLPLALPSRLTTLQKACTEVQFAENPAGCPEASLVGTAIARTPLLDSPLVGPAYLVSHGGAAFPDLVLLLQGEGVTIRLTGNTDIKKGITYSRFEAVPDAPINSFELSLPEGPHSVLAANTSLCSPTRAVTVRKRVTVRRHGRKVHVLRNVKQLASEQLVMPTTIVSQNGVQVTQSTKIAVTGCPKVKAKAQKKTKNDNKTAKKDTKAKKNTARK